MHQVDGRVLLSPSDLVGFLECAHLTHLELLAARGTVTRPDRVDPELELRAAKGQAHESTQLDRLRRERGSAVEIADHGDTLAGLHQAEQETLAAMRSGASLIYQATFFDGRWRGRADFLLRVDEPSALGGWSYEVADAKLARSVKVGALLQMCEYSLQLSRLQGRMPENMHVVLGTGEQETHRVAEYMAYVRAARERFERAVDGGVGETYPHPVRHCDVCAWLPDCERRRRDDDHLCIVAGMRRDHTRRLVDAGISTVAQLAVAPAEPVAQIGDAPWERLRRQAALQVEERRTGRPVHELVDCDQAGLGLAALPPPSPGDLFFDMEGDPFVEDGGLEYLFGITEVVDGRPRFHAFWGHTRDEEKAAFESLVDFVIERLERDPSLHVYHYAPYEPNALKRLMGRHGTREDQVDRLLRGGVLVDLYQAVRQGVRVSRESYSLKQLEVFFMPPRTEEIADAVGSIVAYERWLDSRDDAELEAIRAYNERDCEATWQLRDWLERLRDEWAQTHGRPLPRPELRSGDPSKELVRSSAETEELVEALTHDVPATAAERSRDQEGRWLLAQLLDWHRREDKASWWAFFDRQRQTDEQLVEDRDAIGAITHLGASRAEGRSTVHRYAFDATQEYKIGVGVTPCDPRTGGPCGEVVAIDEESGVIELRRGPSLLDIEHPRSLIPGGPLPTTMMREALRQIARSVIDAGIDGGGPYRAARDLVLRAPPRIAGSPLRAPLVAAAEDPVEACVRLVAALDGSTLAVQGPPGAGKTYAGAQVIVDQVRRGHRVGVCATTHRAIGELLRAACEAARLAGVPLRVLQRCDEDDICRDDLVRRAGSSADVERALEAGEVDVVGGTTWLLSRPALDGALDVVLVDEAGQMSLANAVVAACAGRNLVLLGDPQQLAQPSQGLHPPGADVSGLGHVLAGAETMPPEQGVFLDVTRRMHPDVCAFVSHTFYDGRLEAHPSCSRQRIDGDPAISGAGLRFAPTAHAGNRTWAPEEVDTVRRLVERLLRSTWTDARGASRPLTPDDILVVAPYNLHVRRLREALGSRARVGTVDKFQGQEAAVSIYAMATSSAEDVPRNLEFLFSRNRLDVAVSRARAVSVLVCSPLLLQAGCRTPEQLRLVSALCEYTQSASTLGADAAREAAAGAVPMLLPLRF